MHFLKTLATISSFYMSGHQPGGAKHLVWSIGMGPFNHFDTGNSSLYSFRDLIYETTGVDIVERLIRLIGRSVRVD